MFSFFFLIEQLHSISSEAVSIENVTAENAVFIWKVPSCYDFDFSIGLYNSENHRLTLTTFCPKHDGKCTNPHSPDDRFSTYTVNLNEFVELQAFTNYTIQFRWKKFISNYWSEPTLVEFETLPAQPLRGPAIAPGVALVTMVAETNGCVANFSGRFFWNAVDRSLLRGDLSHYEVAMELLNQQNENDDDDDVKISKDKLEQQQQQQSMETNTSNLFSFRNVTNNQFVDFVLDVSNQAICSSPSSSSSPLIVAFKVKAVTKQRFHSNFSIRSIDIRSNSVNNDDDQMNIRIIAGDNDDDDDDDEKEEEEEKEDNEVIVGKFTTNNNKGRKEGEIWFELMTTKELLLINSSWLTFYKYVDDGKNVEWWQWFENDVSVDSLQNRFVAIPDGVFALSFDSVDERSGQMLTSGMVRIPAPVGMNGLSSDGLNSSSSSSSSLSIGIIVVVALVVVVILALIVTILFNTKQMKKQLGKRQQQEEEADFPKPEKYDRMDEVEPGYYVPPMSTSAAAAAAAAAAGGAGAGGNDISPTTEDGPDLSRLDLAKQGNGNGEGGGNGSSYQQIHAERYDIRDQRWEINDNDNDDDDDDDNVSMTESSSSSRGGAGYRGV